MPRPVVVAAVGVVIPDMRVKAPVASASGSSHLCEGDASPLPIPRRHYVPRCERAFPPAPVSVSGRVARSSAVLLVHVSPGRNGGGIRRSAVGVVGVVGVVAIEGVLRECPIEASAVAWSVRHGGRSGRAVLGMPVDGPTSPAGGRTGLSREGSSRHRVARCAGCHHPTRSCLMCRQLIRGSAGVPRCRVRCVRGRRERTAPCGGTRLPRRLMRQRPDRAPVGP